MDSKEFYVRIGQEEIGRILDLKETVDHNGLWLEYVARYQILGWSLVAVNAKDGTDLGLDFSQPREVWSQRMADLGMQDVQVNVGIRTGRASRLLVLEVNKGEGALSLDQLGEWRSECVAEVGDSREQHYFTLPPERLVPPSFFLAPQVLIYSEGGLILAPPSIEPQGREPWRWRRPPWEAPPRHPKPAVWQFIRKHAACAGKPADGAQPQVMSWEEVYRLISHHGIVLKALLVPAPSPEVYYYGVYTTALGAGIRDAELLLGLLWHAPHGDSRTHPERWEYLQDLVAGGPLAQGEQDHGSDPYQVPGLPATIGNLGAWSFPEQVLTDAGMELQARFPNGFPGSEGGSEPAAGGFDATVSGQFFQLLAGLGERVIVESCRYEALRSEYGNGAGEVNRRKKEWDQRYCPVGPALPEQETVGVENNEASSSDLVQAWASVMPTHAPQGRQHREVEVAAKDFLNQNPDLAGDRQKILMVIFCLKNYIAINPEFAASPFKEKLEKAGHMARVFLREKEPAAGVS